MPVRAVTFRRRRLSLTSLIDVIFLLLLFFMLSSTFSRNGEIAFQAGSAGGGISGAPPLFLRLDGTSLSLNGTVIPRESLVAAITERIGDTPAPRVILSVTGEATSQALVDVLVPLGRVPGAEITVVE